MTETLTTYCRLQRSSFSRWSFMSLWDARPSSTMSVTWLIVTLMEKSLLRNGALSSALMKVGRYCYDRRYKCSMYVCSAWNRQFTADIHYWLFSPPSYHKRYLHLYPRLKWCELLWVNKHCCEQNQEKHSEKATSPKKQVLLCALLNPQKSMLSVARWKCIRLAGLLICIQLTNC